MKIKRIMTILLSLLSLTSCGAPASPNNTYKQITMNEAIVMMEKEKDYIILDVEDLMSLLKSIFPVPSIFPTK